MGDKSCIVFGNAKLFDADGNELMMVNEVKPLVLDEKENESENVIRTFNTNATITGSFTMSRRFFRRLDNYVLYLWRAKSLYPRKKNINKAFKFLSYKY